MTPTLGPHVDADRGTVSLYTRGPAGWTRLQLRELQDWVIEPRLLQVPGVADITPFGGVIKQYQIASGSAGA